MMPGTETTYTTTQAGPRFAAIQPKYNPDYLRSFGFLLTIIELILSLIVIICIGSTRSTDYYGIGFGIFTGVIGLLLGFAVLSIRAFDMHQNITHFPWAAFWFGAHVFLALCFFISGAICVAAADYASRGGYYSNQASISFNNQNQPPWGNQQSLGWNTGIGIYGERYRLIRDRVCCSCFLCLDCCDPIRRSCIFLLSRLSGKFIHRRSTRCASLAAWYGRRHWHAYNDTYARTTVCRLRKLAVH